MAHHDGREGVPWGGRPGASGACWPGPVICPWDTHTERNPSMAAGPDLRLAGKGGMSVCDRGQAEGSLWNVGFPHSHRKQIWQWEGPLPGRAMSHFFHQPLSPLQVCCLTLWLFCGGRAEPGKGRSRARLKGPCPSHWPGVSKVVELPQKRAVAVEEWASLHKENKIQIPTRPCIM